MKIRPKDDPFEGCDWSIRRFVQRMIRQKDESSYQPITSFRRIILRTNLRIDQSHPSDGSPFERIFVSTNHILRTDHPSDGLSSRPITSFGRIIFGRTFVSTNHILWSDYLWTNFRLDQSHPSVVLSSDRLSSRPIRNPQDNHVTRMVTDRTCDAIQKS